MTVPASVSDYRRLADALAQEAAAQGDLREAQAMLTDPDLRAMAEDELPAIRAQLDALDDALTRLLIPKDPRDEGNLFLEVRAGTGGDEAAIFAGDLFRMYARYAEAKGWRVEVQSANPGEHGGFKEIVARIEGRGAYSKLKYESGTHRVQRVPATETQGRIHTSAATVAILPELEDVAEVVINPADLKVDTFRSSGAGGQHVNKTESAIRVTHVPSGLVVECQTERSQHANRDKAMQRLKSALYEQQVATQQAATAASRRLQVGSGDRSARIRTWNFPQGRVTDHRINLTLYKIDAIMEGELDDLVGALTAEHQAELLAALASHRPDMVLTVNHRGLDRDGRILELLARTRTPLPPGSWTRPGPFWRAAGIRPGRWWLP